MRLYICIDGSFAGTQADAKTKGRGFSETDVPTDKAGLIDYLNSMVDEARAGGACDAIMDEPELTTAYTGPLVPAKPCPVRASIALDEEFEALPLPRQIHLAALALENARSRL